MFDLKAKAAVAARAAGVAAAVIPGGVVGAATAGAALFGHPKKAAPAKTAPARPTWEPSAPEALIQASQALDNEWAARLADEFEPVGIMTTAQYQQHAVAHNSSNMLYIGAPGAPAGHHMDDAFFRDLVRRQWRTAGVRPGAVQQGHMGGHRPMHVSADGRAVPRPGLAPEYSALKFERATAWDGMTQLERVNAYAFRGDSRDPAAIKAANGFCPPATRNDEGYRDVIAMEFCKFMRIKHNRKVDEREVSDYIKGQSQRGENFVRFQMWRQMMDNEQFHIGAMVKDEFLKGYISTSRDPRVCYGFAQKHSNGATASWLYAVHAEGGFLLPDQKGSTSAHASKGDEAEIAFPGALRWDKVVGIGRFALTTGATPARYPFVMYYRHGFRTSQPEAFHALHASFSKVCRPYQEYPVA